MTSTTKTTSPSQSARRRGLVLLATVAAVPALLVAAVWSANAYAWDYRSMSFTVFYAIRGSLIGLLLLATVTAFFVGVVQRPSCVRRTGLWVSAFATLFVLTLLEGAFMFVPRSHGVGYTLGAQIWQRFYFQERNDLGYRDAPHARAADKRTVLAVGDSFTEGHGIADPADRYTDRVNATHADLHLLNVARCGIDTEEEFRRLEQHPVEPDAVLLQYYVNDVEGAAMRCGWAAPDFQAYADVDGLAKWLVRGSFLVNYAYWSYPHADGASYADMLTRAYADQEVMKRHFAELSQFMQYSEQRGVPLVVLLFPSLTEPHASRPTLARVRRLFESRGVTVLDATDWIVDIPMAERLVNSFDAHPSPLVHDLTAAHVGRALQDLWSGTARANRGPVEDTR
ncbi:MAG: SGNH/GDSL hydrolase family protein [Planctomycetota bacterium]